jgi:hypothetical protein
MQVALSFVIWATAIPFLSYVADAAILEYRDNGTTEGVRDANLFFSTWVSVIVVILLVTNVFQASIVTSDWVLLATFSFALSASSIVTFDSNYVAFWDEAADDQIVSRCTDYTHPKNSTCRGATLAFYLGLFSGVIAVIMTLFYRCGPLLHFCTSGVLVVCWGVAVAYITFYEADSVAAGVLYFSCWYVVRS